MAQTTKLFWHGRSQAVRLPNAFRIEFARVESLACEDWSGRETSAAGTRAPAG